MAVATQGPRQFQALFDTIPFKLTQSDAGSLADGAGTTQTLTVPGAALGDLVIVGVNKSVQGFLVSASVSAANTVQVRFQNETGGAVNLTEGTIVGVVLKPKGVFDSL